MITRLTRLGFVVVLATASIGAVLDDVAGGSRGRGQPQAHGPE